MALPSASSGQLGALLEDLLLLKKLAAPARTKTAHKKIAIPVREPMMVYVRTHPINITFKEYYIPLEKISIRHLCSHLHDSAASRP
jgi:hypothetical protein